MTTTSAPRKLSRRAWPLAPALGLLLTTACGGEAPISLAELRAAAYQEPDTGLYVASGDELIGGEAELRALHARLAAPAAETAALNRPLIVNRVGGADDRWDEAQAQRLTYCVSRSAFGDRHAAVVAALGRAAAAWEAVARVRFVHDASRDGTCTRRSAVVFNVRPVCGARYLARAFFPSAERAGRELLIDCAAFGDIAPTTLTGLLRHELGHALGFRHEHTRPEAGVCFEDRSWRALTSYDGASVMHYPHCHGRNEGDLELTARDAAGAAALYP